MAENERQASYKPAQYERYEGGSPEAERLVFERLAREIMKVQVANRRASGAPGYERAFHAKAALGVENARLRFNDDLPAALRGGFAQPGAEYPATVRLSSASGMRGPDGAPDLHGIAVRVNVSAEQSHDLLATGFPVSHARDAREFVAFAKAMAGARNPLQKAFGLFVKLPIAVGLGTANRMRRNVQAATRHTVNSLARETYWSRGAMLWSEADRSASCCGPPWAAAPSRAPTAATRTSCTGSSRAGSAAATSPSTCACSATSTSGAPPSRTAPWSGRKRSPRRSPWPG